MWDKLVDMKKRCTAGFDNAGVCTMDSHRIAWHTPEQALHLRYDYDRCRREAGHEKDPSLPYHGFHLPDTGGAITDRNDGYWDKTWMRIYDIVASSGEKLDWSDE